MCRLTEEYPAIFSAMAYFLIPKMIILIISDIYIIVYAQNPDKLKPWLQPGPPRFKQNQRVVHEVFLNDRAIFKCTALARPAPKIHWFRNGEFLNHAAYANNDRLRENKKHFSLEIRRVEVSDQGSWTCKVWNQAGSIFRNFTLEIIDFCDYFLMHEFPADKVPEKCICLWYLTDEYKKEGINWTKVGDERCEPYKNYASNIRKPFRKKICENGACGNELPGEMHDVLQGVGMHVPISPSDIMHGQPDMDTPDAAAKRLRARTLLQQIAPESNQANDNITSSKDENRLISRPMQDEPRGSNSSIASLSSLQLTSTNTPTHSTTITTTTRSTTRISFLPQKVAPYFKVRDEDAETTVTTPSGRTIRLQCKAGGQPEPQVIWYNHNKRVITGDVRRPIGTEYRLKKNTLEIEDVAESDSGDYTCEAFNSAGSVKRTFKLRVVDRMRSKPIIVPNVLVNQTVDANSTVNFTCSVISDLTPYIIWLRIEKTNDSIYYWNETDGKYVFNFTEMQNVENAIITKTSHDTSTLTLVNVTVADQGIYACVSGNHLGHVIASATLTVNEFLVKAPVTGNPSSKWSRASLIVVVILLILLAFTLIAALFHIFCVRRRSKSQIAEMEQFIGPVRKRVIVTKRPADPDNDGWSDMPSTYQIHVEPVACSGPRRPRLSSDLTFLSDYEIPPDPLWEVERTRLRFVEMLGEGAFGEVWKAMLETASTAVNASSIQSETQEEMPVAVKKLKASAHEKELIDLVSEMETFKVIGHHENLLRLIGCCTGTGPLYVIVELCKHGNLRDFLRAHRPRDADNNSCQVQDGQSPETCCEQYLEPRKLHAKMSKLSNAEEEQPTYIKHLTQRHLVQFAWQVAKGMEFMASRKIIHRDLAARNVLVANDFVMKISDFGLSRDVHYNDYYRKKGNGRLPIKWMALEALDSHVYTIYSDVWSFGILLWEIMTLGGTPYPSIAMQQLYSCLKEGYRMEAPDNCPEEVYDVMVACWQEKPENRPSFDTLVDYFDWMLTQSARDHENYLEVQSVTSDMTEDDEVKDLVPPPPIRTTESPVRRSKMRPLSEPIICPTEPVVYSDSESEFDCESRPLLNDEKAVAYGKCFAPGTPHSFFRKRTPLPESDVSCTLPLNEKGLSSTATVSIDSAIGSPLWSAGTASLQLRSDASENLDKSILDTAEGNYFHAEPVSGSRKEDSISTASRTSNGHYVNVYGLQDDCGGREKLRNSKFPFPPLRHMRFSDSTTYESESIRMNDIGKSRLDGSASVFSIGQTSEGSNKILGTISSENAKHSNGQQRRFSIDSNSSGRGGSSGMSSAEGLGGVVEFSQVEYDKLQPS